MATVLIGGGSGLIGQRLSELLLAKGYEVIHLSRKEDLNAPFPKYKWDLQAGIIDERALTKADYIINLAGAGIADKRWTESRKRLIVESRTQSTLLIKNALARLEKKPKALILASAIGFYGDRGREWVDEDSLPGKRGFLAESTQEWEASMHQSAALKIRQAIIRIGIVLSTKGGALKPFILQNQFRLGNYFGNGKQYYSWIHIDDLCKIFIYAMENESVEGIFNGVGPNPVSLYDFVKSLAKAMDKRAIMIPVPTFAIRLAMGEMADMVLSSTRVSAAKIESTGFQFEHPELVPALKNLLKEESR